ncbi:MAG: polyprenol monophosphomannose synthase [Pirellulales bacterium]
MADADVRSRGEWPAGRVLVQAATYNERENIGGLIDAVLGVSPELQFLIIDDDSPDGTGRLALERAEWEPRLHVLVRKGRRGLGSAIVEGFAEARAHGFEVGVNMDADFSHDPADIPRLVAAIDTPGRPPVDVAIGSRRVAGGRTVGWPLKRHVISRGVSLFTRWALWVPVRDVSSGFRAVRLAVLERVPALAVGASPGECPSGYAFFEFMLWAVHRAGGRIVEVPITFTDRTHGASKADFAEAKRSIGELLRLAVKTWFG